MQLIMGDADNMLGHDWIKALQHVQTPMVIVKGANHFMDGEHEFDLLEHTLDFLKASSRLVPMKWPASISIKQIALAFITGLLVLVSLIGGFAAYQTRNVTRSWSSTARTRRMPNWPPPSSGC